MHAAKPGRSAPALFWRRHGVEQDPDGGPGLPIAEGGLGYSCIAEQRTVETIRFGAPKTPYLKFGDRVRIEMCDTDGHSIFGAIDQEVRRYAR